MTEDITITHSDLLGLLTAASSPDDNSALTTREIVARSGLSYHTVITRMRELHSAGLLEVVHVHRVNMAGILHSQPGYRLKKKPPETEG